MNYIKLLNAAFERFYFDDRLNPTHISLYMALFQEWNSSRFAIEFYVNRRDLMLASKIGSKSTYHKCVTDLHSWTYLSYFPSNNPYKGSKIKMSIIGTSNEPDMERYSPILEQVAEQYRPNGVLVHERHHPISGQVVDPHRPISGQALVSTINNTKQVNNIKPKGWQAVIDFFIEKSFNTDEGKKFFAYYETRNWQTSDGKEIRDWRALATNWMDRAELFEEENKPNKKQVSRIKDNLRTTKNKDYGQPL
ncbi:hypothetical protein [Maribacter sp. ACAM166]|uniref:hypothetical protein n=1 Tax=Maribacter sp. ACAM166 TaxID=2508996 RepID=UPI0010FD8950|nr:hypothetical protein [Maribacter sp. ACAM166]TLP82361.1 hypothetical protein ES765_02705 [Maribacter sp. ACAM166]